MGLSLLFVPATHAAKPIVIGCPLSMAFLYGWDAERGATLAVEEINAAGGVAIGGEKRPFKIEVIDTRDLEPGVPVSEALLAMEKLILDKKADFIVGGPVRSEAALAAMSLLSKHKKVHPDHRSADPEIHRPGGRTVRQIQVLLSYPRGGQKPGR
jgi:branched-chain amino acid transport system substrate-binding protein